MRVNAALVDRASGANRWSNTYETSGDLFAVEDDIGTQVLTALELVLGLKADPRPAPARAGDARCVRPVPAGTLVPAQAEEQPHAGRVRSGCSRSALAKQPGVRARPGGPMRDSCRTLFRSSGFPRMSHPPRKSCARARALDSTAHEVFQAIGSLRLDDGRCRRRRRLPTARRSTIVPDSPDALIGLADALAAGDKTEEAERTLRARGRSAAARRRAACRVRRFPVLARTAGRSGRALRARHRPPAGQPERVQQPWRRLPLPRGFRQGGGRLQPLA